ncbi:hypothetical protein Y032_0102g3447 [Ancylostoma ceylanicum]|uniref:Uncharacterized protein n=1 Tax=Ancylostoma ceylanicum TaxID=53326 RepID=A0A016THI8_9BILA|nr:hypothetical protein Y032_0102g3447 [Ancylostoma ceylanicum]
METALKPWLPRVMCNAKKQQRKQNARTYPLCGGMKSGHAPPQQVREESDNVSSMFTLSQFNSGLNTPPNENNVSVRQKAGFVSVVRGRMPICLRRTHTAVVIKTL